MPKLVALKEHSYGGKLNAVGDVYEATDGHARLLKATGRAADEVAPAAAPEPEPEAPPVPRRGRYARRDMQASEEARVMTTDDFPKGE